MSEIRFVAYHPALGGDGAIKAEGLAAKAFSEWPDSRLVAEFVEVSARSSVELSRAISAAAEAKAVLVMATLGRLARDPTFLAKLADSGVEVRVLDNPAVCRASLPAIAAMAGHEAAAASRRTREALARAKVSGQRLGVHGATLAKANRAAAFERIAPLAGLFGAMIGEGLSVRAMADRLNAQQIPSPGDGVWHGTSVHRALKRLAPERFGRRP